MEDDHGEAHILLAVTLEPALLLDVVNSEDSRVSRADQLKPQYYFHISYRLLPDDQSTASTDLVTFSTAAKVYHDAGARVLKGKPDGETANLYTFTWTQSHPFVASEDFLLKLFDHTMEVRVWVGKDTVSTKALFDRPKPFQLNIDDSAFPASRSQLRANKDSRGSSRPPSNLSIGMPSPRSSKAGHSSHSSRRTPSKQSSHLPEKKMEKSARHRPGSVSSNIIIRTKGRGKKKATTTAAELKEPAAVIRIPLSGLFEFRPKIPGVVYSHVDSPLVGGCYNAMFGVMRAFRVGIMVDQGPLLTEKMLKRLNPMTINIRGVSNLPDMPIGYDELRERCEGVLAKYSIFNLKSHQTERRPQEKDVVWDDSLVILAGCMDRDKIREAINGPPMEIEIHDRDLPLVEGRHAVRTTLFDKGSNKADQLFGTHSLTEQFRTSHNAFLGRLKPWSPYGIAKVDLSGLLARERLELVVAVERGPSLSSEERKQQELSKHIWGEEPSKISPGCYLEAGTVLYMRVQLAVPLWSDEACDLQPTQLSTVPTSSCLFGRIVYILRAPTLRQRAQLQQLVVDINATALQLDMNPQRRALESVALRMPTSEELADTDLDILTGFEMYDGEVSVTILEGLANRGLAKAFASLPHPESCHDKRCSLLYDTSLLFSRRLYGANMPLNLLHLKLAKPLRTTMQWGKLYVRSVVPTVCLNGLLALNQLLQFNSLSLVCRTNSLPTADMLEAISRQFGCTPDDIPALEDLDERLAAEKSLPRVSSIPKLPLMKTSRPWTPIDHHNTSYEELLTEKVGRKPQNFLSKNKQATHTSSSHDYSPHIRSKSEQPYGEHVHPYSIQSYNSSLAAVDKLRRTLSESSAHLRHTYTFSHGFHHSSAVPVVDSSPSQFPRSLRSVHQDTWLTSQGFLWPSPMTALESNKPSLQVDRARVDELAEPWQENVLHGNKFRPFVERPQISHLQDMNLVTQAPQDFGMTFPVTIHLAGDTLAAEEREARDADHACWLKSVLPGHDLSRGARVRVHRLAPSTELKTSGLDVSSQVDRAKGLLKDEPQKLAYRFHGLAVSDMSSLGVVRDPSVDTAQNVADSSIAARRTRAHLAYMPEAGEQTGFVPGPNKQRSLKLEINKVPIEGSCRGHEGPGTRLRLPHYPRDPLSYGPMKRQTSKSKTETENVPLQENAGSPRPGAPVSQTTVATVCNSS